MFQIKVVKEITTYILCSVTFFFENRIFYEIMWKNMVQQDRSHDNMALAHCMLDNQDYRYTCTGCVILIAFPLL
jgi:hypothetical protein